MATRMTTRWRTLAATCLLASLTATPAVAAHGPGPSPGDREVEVLDLGVTSEGSSWATHVTDSGLVFGGRTFAVGPFSSARAWRWEDGVATDLPGVGQGSTVTAVNERGDAVGYLVTELERSRTRAVLWPRDGTLVELGSPDLRSRALDVNRAGLVVGDAQPSPAEGTHAASWRDGRRTMLDDGAAAESTAVAVNDRGQVAGHVVDDGFRRRAVVWHRDRMTAFDLPDVEESSEAVDIGRRGQVLVRALWTDEGGGQVERWYLWDRGRTAELPVVLVSGHLTDRGQVVGTAQPEPGDAFPRAVLVDDGAVTDLGTLGRGARVTASDGRGQVVGASGVAGEGPAFPEHAVLFEDGDVVDLGTLGGPASEATDVNRRGQVVGSATVDETGTVRAVLWTVDG